MGERSGSASPVLRAAALITLVAVGGHLAIEQFGGALATDPAAGNALYRRGAAADAPAAASRSAGHGLTLDAGPDGHFRVRGEINGAAVAFLVDTGATAVVLDADQARAAGLRPRPADYTVTVTTANGLTRAAPVTIRRVRAGPIDVGNVKGMVVEQSMHGTVLLGMSFLSRLDGYSVRGGRMVLRW